MDGSWCVGVGIISASVLVSLSFRSPITHTSRHHIRTAKHRNTSNFVDRCLKDIDWTELKSYEEQDNTSGTQTYACSGDSCEVVDLTS